MLDLGDGLVCDGGVDHNAEGPLVLCVLRLPDGAGAAGHPASHAHEHRDVGHTDDGLGNGGLGGKGIDRDDGVSVDVLDDGHIGGEHQGFDAAAKDADAAAF